jgi:putative spermidine/putrescine transport system substrate-binding protein
MISRRSILTGGALLASQAIVGRAQSQAFSGQTLRVATQGGTWQQWVAANVEPPFRSQSGASVEYVVGVPLQHMAALIAAKGQNPPFDIVSLTDDLALTAARQNLVLPVDGKLVPNIDKLPDSWRPNNLHGTCDYAALEGIVYDAGKYQEAALEPPTTWDSLADSKLASRVAIPDISFAFKQVYAAINYVNTGDEANFDGTLSWLSRLKSPVIYADFPTLQTRFNSGEIWAMIGVSGYVLRWPNRTLKLVLPPVKDKRGVLYQSSMEIPKGTTRKELAEVWMNTWLSDQAQLKLATSFGYSPSNLVAAREAAKDPRIGDIIVSTPEAVRSLYYPNWEKVTAAFPEWVEKWNRRFR